MRQQLPDLKSLQCRVCHSINYCLGSTLFLLGSLFLFPYFQIVFYNQIWAGWLFVIGSLTFIIADCIQLRYYMRKIRDDYKNGQVGVGCVRFNYLLMVAGRVGVCGGSFLFIGETVHHKIGMVLFVLGSFVVIVCQTWKVFRVIREGIQMKRVVERIEEDFNGFLIDVLCLVGTIFYLAGAFPFASPKPVVRVIAATLFSFGGWFLYLSSGFMINRYFLSNDKDQGAIFLPTNSEPISDIEMAEKQTTLK